MKNSIRMIAIVVAGLMVIAACGQKGPLFLPGNPSEIRPQPPQDEQAQNDEDEDDDNAEDEDDEARPR